MTYDLESLLVSLDPEDILTKAQIKIAAEFISTVFFENRIRISEVTEDHISFGRHIIKVINGDIVIIDKLSLQASLASTGWNTCILLRFMKTNEFVISEMCRVLKGLLVTESDISYFDSRDETKPYKYKTKSKVAFFDNEALMAIDKEIINEEESPLIPRYIYCEDEEFAYNSIYEEVLDAASTYSYLKPDLEQSGNDLDDMSNAYHAYKRSILEPEKALLRQMEELYKEDNPTLN